MTTEQHQQIVALLHEVGTFQLKYFRNIGEDAIDMKAAKETVSFVDVESEKLLKAGLSKILPEAGWYGEELGQEGDQDFVWIVDPIDGTTNYLNGIPHFSISIALVKQGTPIYGTVYQPYNREYLSATQGEGATLNGKKLNITPRIQDASEALFATGFPYRSEDLNDAFFQCANDVLRLGRGIRRPGSAALDLAYTGAGWFGGFWESDLQPYDVAAALVIMNEAQLAITNHHGEPYNMFKDRILVTAPKGVHPILLATVAKHYGSLL